MKKGVGIFVFLMLFLLINIVLISAELTSEEENEKVYLAYECLNTQIDNKDCTRMTTEQAIFSLLSVQRCESKVYEDGDGLKCWPDGNCDLKTTAQAILALDQVGEDTTLAEEWLLNKNITPTDLEWYLEVDSLVPTFCTTSDSTGDVNYEIDEDKKITLTGIGNSNACLEVSSSGYWLKIKDTCYDEAFETTCDEGFLTTLLFKKQDIPTVYVLKSTHSETAGAITTEQINSLCFSNTGIACNYEGSLWASLVLNKQGHSLDSFMPYLIGEAPNNIELSPESFLYYLTTGVEYRTQIMQNQISGKWWQNDALNNKYYDTALELLPFQGINLEEKAGTKEWLITEVQEDNGCWDSGNIVNNAFVLYSIWPEFSGIDPGPNSCVLAGYSCVDSAECNSNDTLNQYSCDSGKVCCDDGFGSGGNNDNDCEEAGFFCVAGMMNCEGNLLYEYDCPGAMSLCCDTENIEKTCAEWNGVICSSNEYCKGGDVLDTSDLDFGEDCCVQGVCENIIDSTLDENECEENYGICEPYGCDDNREETSLYSCEFGDICCVSSSGSNLGPDSKSKWWIWVLFILIVLVLIGILFRDKLKMSLLKLKSKKGGKGMSSPQTRPGFPPSSMPPPRMRRRPMPQRRIIPSPGRVPPQQRPAKKPGELDDVLKKLKDMSQ